MEKLLLGGISEKVLGLVRRLKANGSIDKFPVISEDATFTPSLTMRPHHFWLGSTQDALVGWNPSKLAKSRLSRLYKGDLRPEYVQDMVGGGTKLDQEKYRKGNEGYYKKLGKLPDGSFIHLDLQPDGLCNSCIVGQHCMSTNYTGSYAGFYTEHSDIASAEKKQLDRIQYWLHEVGCEEGEDYIIKPTTHTLYNLEGRILGDPQEGRPETVVFDSLIVRTGALRRAMRRASLYKIYD